MDLGSLIRPSSIFGREERLFVISSLFARLQKKKKKIIHLQLTRLYIQLNRKHRDQT